LVPPALKPLVAEHREALRPLVLYREALIRWWNLTARGPDAEQAAVTHTYQVLIKLIDEVGEPTATGLRREWARQRWQETGLCPYCGERGLYHDPDHGRESVS